jgi:hypothetical protein
LPKTLALLATLLLAAFAVGAGASTAAAHGNHAHQVSTSSSGSTSSPQTREIASDFRLQMALAQAAAASEELPHKSPGGSGKSDCCCGNVMCHAGVTLGADVIAFPCPAGARVIAEPSSGRARRNSSGLERPPRSPRTA